MDSQEKLIKDFHAYEVGVMYMSACVSEDMSREDIERQANEEHPLLVLKWEISTEKFPDGESNPHDCEKAEGRKHFLLSC